MVTRETAFRLKYADFEQPEPKFGQIWYAESGGGALGFIQDNETERYPLLFQNIHTGVPAYYSKTGDLAYAPTAADILPLLPYTIRIGGNEFGFNVWETTEGGVDFPHVFHKNMGEALALKWLEINEKK